MKYVYRIYAASGDLLYVGKTGNLTARLSQHRTWMAAYPGATVRVDGPHPDRLAIVLERRAIITERPKRNKAWRSYGDPCIASEATLNAMSAALYLVGPESCHEGWCVQIVEGYGIERAGKRRYSLPYYHLVDLEAKYLELHRADVEMLAAEQAA